MCIDLYTEVISLSLFYLTSLVGGDFIFTTFVIYLNTAEILISIRTEQNMYLLFN